MTNELVPLSLILEKVEGLPWKFALYLPANQKWTLESKGLVLDPNDCEETEEEPAKAKALNLKYALTVHQIRAIVENTRKQNASVTVEDLMNAFLYYYDNDAFIEMNKSE